MALRAAALLVLGSISQAEPPSWEIDSSVATCGPAHMSGPSASGSQCASHEEFSAISRLPLNLAHAYADLGIETDNYAFSRFDALPTSLREVCAIVRAEYYQGDQSVAQLTFQPGAYYSRGIKRSAWDIPVELVSGIPISRAFNGVLGFNDARFYHRFLPIFGIVWQPSPGWRLDALYPEPGLVRTLASGAELRLGGELDGAGFRASLGGVSSPVEFSSYRVGLSFTRHRGHALVAKAAAGLEAERTFDFYRRHQTIHGSGTWYFELELTYLGHPTVTAVPGH